MEGVNWKAIAGWGLILLLAVVIVIGLSSSRGVGGWNRMGPGMMGSWGFGPFGWIGMIFMWLIPIEFLILVILRVISLVRGLTSNGPGRLGPLQ